MATSLTAESVSQRVLVVDDDPALLTLVADTLRRDGFEVFTAFSGPQALEMIKQQGLPHLAVVDVMMPGMDGFEFCRAIQEVSDLPIILLTAIDQEEVVIRGLEHFAEDYITKPFSPRELAARVKRRRPVESAERLLRVVEQNPVGEAPTRARAVSCRLVRSMCPEYPPLATDSFALVLRRTLP